MLIKTLRMENFRQFRGTTKVDFSCDPNKNVTIILGDNTFGKTTLLQAFNWCFYGKVNFDQRPDFLLNYELSEEMRNGEQQIVEVVHSITSKKFEIHGLPGLIFAQLHFSPWRTHIFSLKPSKIRDGQTKYLLRAILSFRTLPADRSIPAGSWSARWQCGQGRY